MSGGPRSSRDSSLEVELPKLIDSSTLESMTMVILAGFGARCFVASRVCLTSVAKLFIEIVLLTLGMHFLCEKEQRD